MDLQDVRILVVAANDDVLRLFRQALRLLNVAEVLTLALRNDVPVPPLVRDVDGVVVFGESAARTFIRRCREPEASPNAFVPIVAAASALSVADVRALISAGAHEVLTFPLTGERVRIHLQRAIFAGRPFVRTETYHGPCRRRVTDRGWTGQERRANAEADRAARAGNERRVNEMLARLDKSADDWSVRA